MKKSLALVLCIVLAFCFSLSACGDSTAKSDSPAPTTASATPTPSTASTAPASTAPASAGPVEVGKDVTLSFSCFLGSGNKIEEYVVNPLIETLAAKTADIGKITVEYYPGAALAAPDATLDAVKEGVCDIGLVVTAYETGTLPISFMMEYPMEYKSAKAASYTMKEFLDTLQPAEYNDVVRIMQYCSGEGIICNNNHEITSVDGVKGLEIRANAIIGKAISAYGGTPVTMTASEAYEAMRSGLVDGYIGASASISDQKIHEVTTYATQMKVFNVSFTICMNKEVYNSLTEAQRAAIMEVANEVFEKSACNYMEVTADATYKAIEALGHHVYMLTDEENAGFADASAGLMAGYAKELDQKGLDGTKAMELLKKIADKYNAMYPDSANSALK